MSPSTKRQFSITGNQWSSGQHTHVSSKFNCIAIVFKMRQDRKSTRLNSSHITISYAVFCLKKKKTTIIPNYFGRQEVTNWLKSRGNKLIASEEVEPLTILQIQGPEGEYAMSPSTKRQFSITGNQWSSGQRTHVSSKFNCIAIVWKIRHLNMQLTSLETT